MGEKEAALQAEIRVAAATDLAGDDGGDEPAAHQMAHFHLALRQRSCSRPAGGPCDLLDCFQR
jgi:hypothetical protein